MDGIINRKFSGCAKRQTILLCLEHIINMNLEFGKSNKPLTVNPKDVQIPSYFPDIPEVRNDIARKYSNIEAMDEKVGEIISQQKDGY